MAELMDQLYDLAIVGGGLAGSALAKSMAEKRFRVVVLEREKEFRDRVRGEQMACWGVAEARELGIYDLLVNGACGQEVRWWETRVGGAVMGRRDFLTSTPQHAPQFMFYHPRMQEILASAAQTAGVEYRRGMTVSGLETGEPATVLFDNGEVTERVSARLVVGADGRGSSMRKWGGFVARHDPPRRLIAGVMFDRMFGAPSEAAYFHIAPSIGRAVLLVPQGNGRVRAYLIYPHDAPHRLQGTVDVSRFIDESIQVGVPAEFYAGASVAGPLASFDGIDNWVEHPYRNGVALVGDAAASNDPCFGQGLSLTLRDVRVLRDELLNSDNWNEAADSYAAEHDRYYGVIHQATECFGRLFYEPGPSADQLRARALPLIAQDSTRMLDHITSGPDLPINDRLIRRFFGEE